MSEGKRVDIEEFIKKYNSYKSESAKDNYLKTTITPTGYHDFAVVCVEADGIIKSSFYDKNGDLHIDSIRKYINYVFTILRYYTNIDVDESNFMHEYDALSEYGLIDKIVKIIPEDYIKTLDSVISMKTQDVMTNEYEIHSYINKQLTKLYPHIGNALDKSIEILNNLIKNMESKKFQELLKNLISK